MTIEQTIQKAIGGGWDVKVIKETVFFDPQFWQALGKSLGWKNEFGPGTWLRFWHNFIDHLAEGKSIESFFEQF